MKLLTGLLAAMLLLAGAGTSHALVRIANDRGGQIGRYVERLRTITSLRPNSNDRWPLRLGLYNCPRRDS